VLARIRKAVVAGVAAGVAAFLGALGQTGAPTQDDLSKALGLAVVAAAVAGYATWRVPNAGDQAVD